MKMAEERGKCQLCVLQVMLKGGSLAFCTPSCAKRFPPELYALHPAPRETNNLYHLSSHLNSHTRNCRSGSPSPAVRDER